MTIERFTIGAPVPDLQTLRNDSMLWYLDCQTYTPATVRKLVAELHHSADPIRIITSCPLVISAVRGAFDRDVMPFYRSTFVATTPPGVDFVPLLDFISENVLGHYALADLFMSGELHEALARHVAGGGRW